MICDICGEDLNPEDCISFMETLEPVIGAKMIRNSKELIFCDRCTGKMLKAIER